MTRINNTKSPNGGLISWWEVPVRKWIKGVIGKIMNQEELFRSTGKISAELLF